MRVLVVFVCMLFMSVAYAQRIKDLPQSTQSTASTVTVVDDATYGTRAVLLTELASMIGATGGTNGGSSTFTNSFAIVASVSALQALDTAQYTNAVSTGYYAAGDGGGGVYFVQTTDSAKTNFGTHIVSQFNASKMWSLVHSGDVNVLQFGAKADGLEATKTLNQVRFLDACKAMKTGGRVIVPKGDYVCDWLQWPSGFSRFTLAIQGRVYYPTNTASSTSPVYDWINLYSPLDGFYSEDITIEGPGTIDGRAHLQSTNTAAFYGSTSGILMRTVKGVKIKGLTITNFGLHGINLSMCDGVEITGNKIYGLNNNRVYIQQEYVVEGNTYLDNVPLANADGIHLYTCRNALVANNYVTTGDDCLSFTTDSAHDQSWFTSIGGCENIVIANNILVPVGTSRYFTPFGVRVGPEKLSTSLKTRNVTISGNLIDCKAGAGMALGVYIDQQNLKLVENVSVTGNLINGSNFDNISVGWQSGNTHTNNQHTAAIAVTGVNGIRFTGNDIRNVNARGVLVRDSLDVVIRGLTVSNVVNRSVGFDAWQPFQGAIIIRDDYGPVDQVYISDVSIRRSEGQGVNIFSSNGSYAINRVTLDNVTVDGVNVASATGTVFSGFTANDVDQCVIRNCIVENVTAGNGITFAPGANSQLFVENSRVRAATKWISATPGTLSGYAHIRNSRFDGVGTDYGLELSNLKEQRIDGNTFEGSTTNTPVRIACTVSSGGPPNTYFNRNTFRMASGGAGSAVVQMTRSGSVIHRWWADGANEFQGGTAAHNIFACSHNFEGLTATRAGYPVSMTTAQRTGLTYKESGATVYDTSMSLTWSWDGTAWTQDRFSIGSSGQYLQSDGSKMSPVTLAVIGAPVGQSPITIGVTNNVPVIGVGAPMMASGDGPVFDGNSVIMGPVMDIRFNNQLEVIELSAAQFSVLNSPHPFNPLTLKSGSGFQICSRGKYTALNTSQTVTFAIRYGPVDVYTATLTAPATSGDWTADVFASITSVNATTGGIRLGGTIKLGTVVHEIHPPGNGEIIANTSDGAQIDLLVNWGTADVANQLTSDFGMSRRLK